VGPGDSLRGLERGLGVRLQKGCRTEQVCRVDAVAHGKWRRLIGEVV